MDVSDDTKPKIISNFDAVEMATGLDVAGDVAFIGNRVYGIQCVDISDPAQMRHIASLLTDESQSVCYANGWLFSGDWAGGEVTVIDVSDLSAPAVRARIHLDGYGDGLAVRGHTLFASTVSIKRAALTTSVKFGLPQTYRYRKKLGGRLKVTRPCHTKKDPLKVVAFKETLAQKLMDLELPRDRPLRLWIYDEARYGLAPVTRRMWTTRGTAVVCPVNKRTSGATCLELCKLEEQAANFCSARLSARKRTATSWNRSRSVILMPCMGSLAMERASITGRRTHRKGCPRMCAS